MLTLWTRHFAIFFCAVLATKNIASAEAYIQKPLPLANSSGEASSIVHGCVSAITGDYIEAATDLVIPGPEPIVFERFYSSADYSHGSLWNGWRHNQNSSVYVVEMGNGKQTEFLAQYMDLSGASSMHRATAERFGKTTVLPLSLRDTGRGLTNLSGEVSGRTNIKNQMIHYNDRKGLLFAKTGSGVEKHFSVQPLAWPLVKYDLKLEKKTSGNLVHYSYDKNGRISEVKATDHTGKNVFGSLKFVDFDGELRTNPRLEVHSSDGRKVLYHLLLIKSSKHDKKIGIGDRYYLREVERSDAPRETYEYAPKAILPYENLVRRNRPDGRFLAIEYYGVGRNDVGGKAVELDRENFRLNRVRLLREPVGVDGTPVVTHRFFYDLKTQKSKNGRLEVLEGITEACDALGHKVVYHYSPGHRLKTVEKFRGTSNYSLYSVEKNVWGAEGSADVGNLICRSLEDGSGRVLCARVFKYDSRGNIVQERFYGNLTGKNQPSIALHPGTGLPLDNGCDCYVKEFAYSDDGLNLLLKEVEPNGKVTTYGYQPGTDLLTSKLIMHNGTIKLREFHDYDENGILIRSTADNGTSPERRNLNGVTEWQKKVIKPKATGPGVGLPEVVEEKSMNLTTGQEFLLKKVVNAYSPEGRLVRQEHYDSHNKHCYTLEWKYDAHGNVVWERNALEEVVERRYDANDNLVYERGPRLDLHRDYTYDFANRCLREEEVQTSGKRFITRARYDYLGNCVTKNDIMGNETESIYDEFGRVVETVFPAIVDEDGCLVRPKKKTQYDILDNPILVVDAKGRETKTDYNVRGQPIAIQYPDGTSEKFECNLDGTLKKAIAKNGAVTHYTYDIFGHPTQEEILSNDGALLSKKTSTYNAFRMTSTTDAEGHSTHYDYDAAGRVTSIVKGNSRTDFEYDNLGRVAKAKEWFGEGEKDFTANVKVYDFLDRTLEERTESALGGVLSQKKYAYDVDGNCVQATTYCGAGEAISRTEYNAHKQPVKVVDAEEKHHNDFL